MTHLDLFSGIGGFSLAAQWAGFQTIAFCEIEPYAQQVLIEKFGAVLADANHKRARGESRQTEGTHEEIRQGGNGDSLQTGKRSPRLHTDIFTLDGTQYRGVTLITGGFPCQPFSCAGKRRGKEDDRHLWPEMRRVIAEARPAYVLAENVPGIIGMELDNCLSDLEAIGYACGTIVVPACAVDARHRRDRVWILAKSSGTGTGSGCGETGDEGWSTSETGGEGIRQIYGQAYTSRVRATGENVANPESEQNLSTRSTGFQSITTQCGSVANSQRDDNGRTNGTRRGKREQEQAEGDGMRENGYWLAEPDVGRVANGIPNRAHRLRALGNAIVPQVAYQILKALP